MVSRRALIAGLATAATLPSALARNNPPIVGFVGFASVEGDSPTLTVFRSGLRDLGYDVGRNILVDAHSVRGDLAKGADLIGRLANRPVDVFLSPGPAATRAIARQTKIPVVAIGLPTEPGIEGLFASLSRPGGSVTGFSTFGEELASKRIEILRQVAPHLTTVGVLHNALDPTFSSWGDQTMESLRAQGLRPIRLPLTSTSSAEVAGLMNALKDGQGQAVIVVRDFLTTTLIRDVGRIAAAASIMVVGEHREHIDAGALLTYGPDVPELFRKAAGYVDRILKGEPVGSLPIQLPTKFEFIINARVARALGISIPQTLAILADDIID